MAAPDDRALPDLRALRALVIVSEAGSLARGAVLANVPQSTISRHLAAIEEQVGGRLFHRTGRGVKPTELGERYVLQARSVLSQAAAMVQDAAEFAGRSSSKVSVGILTSLIDPFVPRLFAATAQRHSHITLRVLEGSSSQLEDWITSGRVDLCIVHGLGRKPGSQAVEVGRIALHLVSRANDRRTEKATVKFQQLAGLPLVLPGPESSLRAMLDRYAHLRKTALTVALEADSLAIQKSVVQQAGIYTILAEVAVAHEIEAGTLRSCRIVDPSIQRTFVLDATTHHPMSTAARQVYRLALELASVQPWTRVAATAKAAGRPRR